MSGPQILTISISFNLSIYSLTMNSGVWYIWILDWSWVIIPVLTHLKVSSTCLLSSLSLVFQSLFATAFIHLGIISSFCIRLVLCVRCLIISFRRPYSKVSTAHIHDLLGSLIRILRWECGLWGSLIKKLILCVAAELEIVFLSHLLRILGQGRRLTSCIWRTVVLGTWCQVLFLSCWDRKTLYNKIS